ncbi:hypothetical protein ACI48J_15105 [Paenibacillus chitinolyticus]|uniref:hypothetical protein n=1 Tax=Paenibacillus chitinolyticus TaxID=79263 RepID=UPI0038639070
MENSFSYTETFRAESHGKGRDEESLIYLLLQGQKGKTARLTLPVNIGQEEEHEAKADRYITVDLHKYSRKMKVELTESGGVRVKIRLKIIATVFEYPPDRLDQKETSEAG